MRTPLDTKSDQRRVDGDRHETAGDQADGLIICYPTDGDDTGWEAAERSSQKLGFFFQSFERLKGWIRY
ncbi:hypothetical protein D3C78_1554530 [compost metagenome]